MQYPGGKGGAGVYQKIINLMPAHERYIETHLGGANIFERKQRAAGNIVIDADPVPLQRWRNEPGVIVVHGDASSWLRSPDSAIGDQDLIYADPPYMMETRKGGKIYRCEYTDDQHRELLSLLLTMPARVMISGYRSSLYDEMLASWHRVDFQAMTRRGPTTESLWMNYTPPAVPADLQYVGSNFRERERIKRRRQRWVARLLKMDPAERAVIAAAIAEISDDGSRATPNYEDPPSPQSAMIEHQQT